MDLQLSPEQKQLVDAFAGLYAKCSTGERVRQAEPAGFDPELWSELVDNGVLQMALAESAGGWGASRLDLALVAEVHGAHVGSAPLVEAQAAVQMLAAAGEPAAPFLERVIA
ncbi:MAG TPA: acyl-CoA dehydrogenase family protein, partial [Mycobacteriales bacterium]|nr:acyl-CoA dehydrogenase family protein [Mycobacteriales bacterium]